MEQQGQQGPMGPQGRRLHIAHRRSPSELTPLMSKFSPSVEEKEKENTPAAHIPDLICTSS